MSFLQPTTTISISSEPDGLEGREALLRLVTITAPAINQSKVIVKCNLCGKSFAGLTERIAAHFAKESGRHVMKCTKATREATALGKKTLKEYDAKRSITRKRKAESAVVKSHQTYLRCKDDGQGTEAANKTYLRLLVATGQSFSLGESAYFRDFVEAVSKVPGWRARERHTLAEADLDAEYDKVDAESKVRLESNGLQRGKTLQTDGMTTKTVS